MTVLRALRHPEMVSEALRRRVGETVLSLAGVIVPSYTNGVFDDYLTAIQDVFVPAGIQMLVSNVRYSAEVEETAIGTLLGHHPEGMILAGVDQTENSRRLLKNSGIPIVQTMAVIEEPIDLNIGLSHDHAGFAAVQYLHGLGRRRIAHLTARRDPRAQRRHAGYQRAMDELGLGREGLVAGSPDPSTVAMGGTLFENVLRRHADLDAVFCCNDDLALGVLFECQRRGIDVPGQVAIVGFNNLDFCIASVPPLTSVSTERAFMGTWAAEAILEIIRCAGKRPEQHRIDVGFYIKERGSSVGAAVD